jgi:potassium-dependent mechanosensitive channel
VDLLSSWTHPDRLLAALAAVEAWIEAHVLTPAALAQIVALLATFLLARLMAPRLQSWLDRVAIARLSDRRLKQAAYALLGLSLPIVLLVLQGLSMLAAAHLDWPVPLIRIVIHLVAVWIVIRLTASLMRDPFWSRLVAVLAWSIAALSILGLLGDVTDLLDSLALQVGKVRISALAILQGAALLVLLLWVATWLSAFVERRINAASRLTPSVQLLFGKLFKIGLFSIAILMAMSSIGIDITALAVFTGALGVGVGFGMQAMVSNFIAGVILLVERSLKIGDFVELTSGVRGEVREINIRNAVITTNDNIDIIVPNSEFVNGQVTNWTFREASRRLRVPFGVAYGSDKERVRVAGLEAATAVTHTLLGHPAREPQVWLVGFGDSSLNFELVVWLTAEAVKRPAAVNAAYCWELETALSRHGIELPFPQRDLHIRSAEPLRIEGVRTPRSAPDPEDDLPS